MKFKIILPALSKAKCVIGDVTNTHFANCLYLLSLNKLLVVINF